MANDLEFEIDSATVLRGVLPPGREWTGSRLTAESIARVPADTAAAGGVPAGVRLELTGSAAELELELGVGARSPVGSPTLPLQVSVWIDDELHSVLPVTAPAVTVRIPLATPDDARITVYLPEGDDLRVIRIRSIGGLLRPAARGLRWLVYGDSITQGWSTTDAGATWPARLARAQGLDLVNLGFAGAARGELPVALQLAACAPEVVTLAWGTNSWSTIPVDGESIATSMRLFLAAIRLANPTVPVLVVSPIVRPAAEDEPNVFGASLRDLRRAMETAVLTLVADDPRLALLPGESLVHADLLVDGVHPGDAGHAKMASLVGEELARIRSRPD